MNIERVGYFNNMQVFRKEQNYLLMASSMYFGLSVQEIKRLAYEYGHKLDVNMPPRCTEIGMAGTDWLGSF